MSDPVAPGNGDLAAAESTVENFFMSFGLAPGEHLRRLVARALARTRARSRTRPQADLATTALAEVEADVAAWAVFVLGEERIGEHSPVMLARAAYRACGGTEVWPDVLLVYELPETFVEAMREAAPDPTPPEQQGVMGEQPLDTWSLGSAIGVRRWTWLRNAVAGR